MARPGTKPGASSRKAIVIGGSVGGLFIGNMLLGRGWTVDIFERATDQLASRGAGIARHPEMAAVFAAAGITDERPPGIRVEGRMAFDSAGRELARFAYPQYLTAWGHVFRPIRAAFPSGHYHQGRELSGIDFRPDTVVARFADGAEIEGDILIGADGTRSRVRALHTPQVIPRYSGYVAWRGLIDETDLPPSFRADAFRWLSFCFPPGGEFVAYPVAGADDSVESGRRRYNFLWYRPVAEGGELDDLLTDNTGHIHEGAIPPPLIRSDHIGRLKDDAHDGLPARFADVVSRASRYLLQPIYDVESEQIGFGRVALLGDAAFVARPHVGIGVLKAGLDALELARCLDTYPVPEAIEHYQQARVDVGRKAVHFASHLGAFMARRLPGPTSDPTLGLSLDYIISQSARPLPQFT
ncbi:MAG: FAD-dependent oxidoreductase [Alphaproteobacteria bacterium]|nr:FAD-dependent oxidoreductase [Alphaproteobacteria bacterium]